MSKSIDISPLLNNRIKQTQMQTVIFCFEHRNLPLQKVYNRLDKNRSTFGNGTFCFVFLILNQSTI